MIYKNTIYFGEFKAKDLYKYVKSADIGLSVLHPTPNYKKAIPTKVIEYMACELPVILSDFPFWKDLFGDIGIYTDPLDVSKISKSIKLYIDNKDKLKEIGKFNRENFVNNFCWDSEEKKLLKLYSDLLS